MNVVLSDEAQIFGFRKDRLGARIVAIGNLLFLEDNFNANVRFLWASTSEEHDMNIHDAAYPILIRHSQTLRGLMPESAGSYAKAV